MVKEECPFCGSEEVSKPKPSRKAFAWSFLLLGFPLLFLKKTQHCFDCQKEFS
jgi:DNA-directed RNA polymerase subunit RPC12/RpoP